MAWFMLVQGCLFDVVSDDPYALEEQLQQHPDYQALGTQAIAQDLLLSLLPNTDDDLLAVFVGHELLPDRHSYQGKTQAAPLASTAPLDAALAPFAASLRTLFSTLNLTVKAEITGIVLSQFE